MTFTPGRKSGNHNPTPHADASDALYPKIPELHLAGEAAAFAHWLERDRRWRRPILTRQRRVGDIDDLIVIHPDLQMIALEHDSQVVPVVLMANLGELAAVLQVGVVLRAAVAGRQPVDVSADGLRQLTVDDNADVLARLAPAEVELVAGAEHDAAIEDAGGILAQVGLLLDLAVASGLGSKLRRALHVRRLVQLVVELEFEVVELVYRRERTAAAVVRD